MADRIIEIAEAAANLRVSISNLEIAGTDSRALRIPFEEIAVLVLAHPQVVLTQPVLATAAAAGTAIVTCDEKRLPVGLQLPLVGHSTHTERVGCQARLSLPRRKAIWKQLIVAKIRAQGRLLQELHGQDAGLLELSSRVRSGDAGNHEAVAARRYWPALFPEPGFRRDRATPGLNAALNYGYAILRACVARAIVAAGLHPALGVHHHNRYDAFCLADDLMEPFRTLVDRVVHAERHVMGLGDGGLERDVRARLLAALLERFQIEGESRSLFDVLSRVCTSLVEVMSGDYRILWLPRL